MTNTLLTEVEAANGRTVEKALIFCGERVEIYFTDRTVLLFKMRWLYGEPSLEVVDELDQIDNHDLLRFGLVTQEDFDARIRTEEESVKNRERAQYEVLRKKYETGNR